MGPRKIPVLSGYNQTCETVVKNFLEFRLVVRKLAECVPLQQLATNPQNDYLSKRCFYLKNVMMAFYHGVLCDFSREIHSPTLTANAPENRPFDPKGKEISYSFAIHFQVLLLMEEIRLTTCYI